MQKKIINRRTKRVIENALKEDISKGDITSELIFNNSNTIAKAVIISKQEQIVAGIDLVKEVFKQCDKKAKVTAAVQDCQTVSKGDIVFNIEAKTTSILKAERVSLNFLGHASGVATKVSHLTKILDNPKIQILDTRKTLPGLREIQKYAVVCGGGKNHRLNLNDMVLIKENHIMAAQSIENALKLVCASTMLGKRKVEIEIEKFSQLEGCIEHKPDIIMLDEMESIDEFEKSIEFIRKNLPKCKIEISGNINENNIAKFRHFDIDFISIGAITHSVICGDYSLLIL